MTSNQIKHIVILGGGTAGWLAANHLAKKLLPGQPHGVRITLVESANIAPVGVGEGTVPAIRQTLQYLGISETELMQKCDTTFKQSIKFIDWQPPGQHGQQHSYHHVFDYPSITDFNGLPYWQLDNHQQLPFADAFSIQAHLCEQGRGPKLMTHPEFAGICNYAYHFDAGKFGQLLADHATQKLGVERHYAEISDAILNTEGNISALVTDNGERIDGDFFVDCSGFQSLLLGQKMAVPFVDKSQILFADTALAIQVPYPSAEQPIPCSTLATAKSAGWIWDIGLTQRRGIGYVYSSAHSSDEQAEQHLRDYIGPAAEGIDARRIPMRTGYLSKFWDKNCVAIGLSQGFVEPLEATGLLLFDISARMLAEQFPDRLEDIALTAQRFNQKMTHAWDKVVDFIKLHYHLSHRDDSDFWRDNRNPTSVSPCLLDDLQHWRHQLPSHYDFTSISSIFNLENYLYVLYGMNFTTDLSASAYRFTQHAEAQQHIAHLAKLAKQAEQQLLPHRELLQRIARYGIQRI